MLNETLLEEVDKKREEKEVYCCNQCLFMFFFLMIESRVIFMKTNFADDSIYLFKEKERKNYIYLSYLKKSIF